MKNFAITGVAGYIAPRHLQAIKDTGNRLEAAVDPHDSVGILDRFFPDARYFSEFERFDRHIEKLRRAPEEKRVHYVSICSPNYLHDAHIRFAMRVGADAICEKPLVLRPKNLDALEELASEQNRRINVILQLRLHPQLIALRERILSAKPGKKHEVTLTYVTPRGPWYLYSWKGNPERSGGLATNIGIHLFDLMIWLFGAHQNFQVHLDEPSRNSGYVELERARVRWFLSIDRNDLPRECKEQKQGTFRSILIDGEHVEFSDGFTDLHTISYANILAGNGFGIAEARPSIQLVDSIRNVRPVTGERGMAHPFLQRGTELSNELLHP